ncbi:MAG: lytic transglycosylase domain-containing protein [Sulfurovum sp.]|jgi:soluble lytic murein transglycosylase|nr:MAG: Soluble lytic murein transglycosylase [Arcobacter lacus]
MLKKTLWLNLFTALSLCASTQNTSFLQKDFDVTIDWLEEKPKSYAKDFFIIQFLNKENLTKDEALKALEMARNKKGRVKKAFSKNFTELDEYEYDCYTSTLKELFKKDDKCLALGISLNEAVKTNKNDLKKIITRIDDYPTLKNDLEILLTNNRLKALEEEHVNRFYRLFFETNRNFRLWNFNKTFKKDFLTKLSKHKDFSRFISYISMNNIYKTAQKSFLNLEANDNLDFKASFTLAINAIKHNNEVKALEFLEVAYKKAYYKMDKDNVLFWQYKLTNNSNYLSTLASSWDVNIYSIYAKEKLSIPINNIIFDVPLKNEASNFNYVNQFEWINVLDDIKKGINEDKVNKYYNIFTDDNTLPHYVYILKKFHKYKKHYFITPYEDIFNQFELQDKVLMYSIAKQESNFIPSSISYATAQGIMQIMPFLSEDLAKRKNDEYNIYHQFIPKTNIEYAKKHIDVLNKQFNNNILMVAYAYNGGAGYLKSQLKKDIFQNKYKYDPYFSMEFISYDQTKKYGKKVLGNYLIYNNYLNEKEKLTTKELLQKINL